MTNENVKLGGMRYSCNSCCNWVLESEAITEEGNNARFCSAGCLEKWRVKQTKNEQEKKIDV